MRIATSLVLSLLAASPASAYYVYARSFGFQESYSNAFVDAGNLLGDASGNSLDGYASAAPGEGSGFVELHIPASEVDLGDYLLVSGQLHGEVRGAARSGAAAASEMADGALSFEIVGGTGTPQNPIFLSVPEPGGALLGGCAIAAIAAMARKRRRD